MLSGLRLEAELSGLQVSGTHKDPGSPSQRDADGVVLRRGSYLSALAEIGTFEHSLTTDLLNHLVLVQKVFMKLRLRGIRLTATTPTASAVRLQTGTLDLQLSNRVQNASRAVSAMKLFGKGQVDLSLALGQLLKVSLDDWKPDPRDSSTTNLCVVSEGTYEICSRTIVAQAGSKGVSDDSLRAVMSPTSSRCAGNAKWILNVLWQMEGVDIHVDTSISKALSALFRTLTALTGDGDDGGSPEEQAAQEPVTLRHACLHDAKKRSRLIEKEMNEQAKIISDLRFLGASQSTIEQEERRLKELETAVFNDFRRDVIKKLHRQSVKVRSDATSPPEGFKTGAERIKL
ncbi:conserved hypothetical protein [Ixodes scapularis]|uniref:Bridge-like lipid transfer protein family member 1 C-terminal domain-containing protein n=1 Tax=Ixodes scapularis TaxID=6945 RepID=B7PWK4_IXOSC|nr:conserved hypothetical protein [Ixodes scapularis]|eukprot:XP_002409926.1 conserved hypothetical protein [Ixodes scapularis]